MNQYGDSVGAGSLQHQQDSMLSSKHERRAPGAVGVKLATALQPKIVNPPSKLTRTLDIHGARAGPIKTKR